MIQIKIKPSVINSIYLKHAFFNNRRIQIYYGGSSSGKSFAIIGQRVIYDIMQGKRNYLIVRNTGATIHQSVWLEVIGTIAQWNLEKYFAINKSTSVITCLLNNRQIIFRGLDDVQKIKSVRAKDGAITDIIIEEATELQSRNIYKELMKRQRGHSEVPKRFTFIFNPILQSHWIYTEFFQGFWKDGGEQFQANDRLSILKTTYKDNEFLTEEDIKDLESETDRYFYEVYTLGNWGVLGNLIYRNWEITDLSGMVFSDNVLRYGIDWGFSADPFAFGEMAYYRQKKELYIKKEIYASGMLNEETMPIVKQIAGKSIVTCDGAEPKSIEEFRRYGINAKSTKKGKGSVEFGVKFLQGLKIYVDKSCQNTINEFQQYKWKEDRYGNVLPIPLDKHNHAMDMIRYALEDDMVEKERWGF